MTIKMWRAVADYCGGSMAEVSVTRFNDKSVWFRPAHAQGKEVRLPRRTSYAGFFETIEEASAFLSEAYMKWAKEAADEAESHFRRSKTYAGFAEKWQEGEQ